MREISELRYKGERKERGRGGQMKEEKDNKKEHTEGNKKGK